MPGSCNASPTSSASRSRSPPNPETTALGAAYHAGQAAGLYGDRAELDALWKPGAAFEPAMSEGEREARYGGWLQAVARVRSET